MGVRVLFWQWGWGTREREEKRGEELLSRWMIVYKHRSPKVESKRKKKKDKSMLPYGSAYKFLQVPNLGVIISEVIPASFIKK